MKSVLLTFILTALLGVNAYALQGWSLQTNPLGAQGSDTTPGLGRVQFVSSTEGWIAAGNGDLLHTTNGGTQWTAQAPGGSDTVSFSESPGLDLSFINATTGWAIGTLGGNNNPHGAVLYKTTNSGGTWSRQVLSSSTWGFGVQFVDANNGWAMVLTGVFPTNFSGAIIHTTDGGVSWSTQYSANGKVAYVSFSDATNGLGNIDSVQNAGQFFSPCEILHTTNGGTTWTTQLRDTTPGGFESLQLIDRTNGWVVGDSAKILHTTNGGANWLAVTNTGITSSAKSKAVFFLDQNNGWIGSSFEGTSNSVLHTTDGGTSWETQSVAVQYNIFSICFIDANNGWLSADYGGIAHTTNGGEPTAVPRSSQLYSPEPFRTRTKLSQPVQPVNNNSVHCSIQRSCSTESIQRAWTGSSYAV